MAISCGPDVQQHLCSAITWHMLQDGFIHLIQENGNRAAEGNLPNIETSGESGKCPQKIAKTSKHFKDPETVMNG